jgi:hypothetical protein
MALTYAVSDLSLKDVAAWANALGLAQITGPGLFYRLREAVAWLERVLAQTLQKQVEAGVESRTRLRVVDATVIHRPGATGTEWRAHVLIDPGTGGLTDAQGGEGAGTQVGGIEFDIVVPIPPKRPVRATKAGWSERPACMPPVLGGLAR